MRAALLLLASPALADSPDAWAAFRAEVEAACRALVADPGEVSVEVSPFGSESYGAALVTLAAPEGTDRMVCVLDKATRRAELAAPFPPEDDPAP
jgi:hypothetical protein